MENKVSKIVPILVILLIVASFFLGSMYTKVNMLEKGVVAGAKVGDVANNNNNAPQVEPTPKPVDIDVNGLTILGDKNAKTMLVVYTDFQCPYCKRLADDAMVQIKKEYIDTGKVKMVVKNFPLIQIHPYAQKAAEAYECAAEQGKRYEYHDKLFANQNALTIDDLKKYATDLGLNTANFSSCLDGNKMVDKVKNDQAEGAKYGVQGTPATFVGKVNGNKFTGTLMSGAAPFAAFQSAIDAVLK
jgi:protein-disulfide isomerase